MRILWLSDFYPPYIGGLERHVQMVAGELASREHQVSVTTIWHEAAPGFELDNGVKVYRLMGLTQRAPYFSSDAHRGFHPTAPDPFMVKSLLKIIERERPQIVIASGWILYSFLSIKARTNAKLFVRHHDYAFICPKRTLFINGGVCSGPGIYKCYPCTADHYGLLKGTAINTSFRFFSQFHGLVDQHLAISQFVAEAINLSNKLPPASIHVVPAPVPDAIFEYKPSGTPPSGIPENGDYILFVGALTRTKGLEILLDAYRGLENKVKLVLIGTDWPDSPARYPEGVIVIKNAPHDFVMQAFNHCLFSVVPSLSAESFGQVAVEAMAASKPVIASAHGGLTDIVIDHETGILVKPGDPVMLHDAMVKLLDDADLRRQLGSKGYLRAKQHFTCTQVTNQIEMICKEVLAGNSG
jgi:glycosyltransferase involved in cell wall biosynthesis